MHFNFIKIQLIRLSVIYENNISTYDCTRYHIILWMYRQGYAEGVFEASV